MVDGLIQTVDEWLTGPTAQNEWAKPIYRIWLDMNGNPNDGAYGNGQGPRQAEVWLDTHNIGFLWYGLIILFVRQMMFNTGLFLQLIRTSRRLTILVHE